MDTLWMYAFGPKNSKVSVYFQPFFRSLLWTKEGTSSPSPSCDVEAWDIKLQGSLYVL